MKETPRKIVPRIKDIHTSVIPAFLDFGSLNAGTPLLTASTPVNAEQPEAKALRITAMLSPITDRAGDDDDWGIV